MHFTGKKLLLVVFVVLLLIGIPVSVYFLQQQQQTVTQAEKSTILTFTPDSSSSAPITKNIGDDISLDVMVDPGDTNLVSFVKLEIQYDPDKIATASTNPFQPNATIFPSVVEGPVYTPGKISVTLSVGPDPTKAIQTKSKAATISFKAVNATDPGTPTLVTYSANTQALSIGPSDQASENVLASSTPATIIIAGAAVSETPTETPVPSVTDTPTPTTEAPTDTPTETPVPTTGTNNVNPVCTELTADQTSGVAPFTVSFTANGTDSDGTVSKATINFGDGQVSDITTGGGIGTATVNAQSSHTYTSGGSFQATAVLTDSNNGVSTESCSQTITVSGETSVASASPTPTIAPTGSFATTVGFGVLALIMIIGGGLLFFAL
jgi:hypothetical protein